VTSDQDIIDGRFRLRRRLGRGGQATTWLATATDTGTDVALKELRLEDVSDWKGVELFEREAKVLSRIDHPNIPHYMDAFHVGDGDEVRFFIAQEYVEGRTLRDLVDDIGPLSEARARDILERLLAILAHLHGLHPPVVHRDVTPDNVLVRPDGELALVDFGAVQAILPGTTGGSTMVGTSGYLTLEQLMGKAVPATDVYAAGATAIFLLSAREPADLPTERNQLIFRDVIDVSEPFADYLGRLLEPAAEDRYEQAQAALDALEGLSRPDLAQVALDEDLPEDGQHLIEREDHDQGQLVRVSVQGRQGLKPFPGARFQPGRVALSVRGDQLELVHHRGQGSAPVYAGMAAAILAVLFGLLIRLPPPFRLGAIGVSYFFGWLLYREVMAARPVSRLVLEPGTYRVERKGLMRQQVRQGGLEELVAIEDDAGTIRVRLASGEALAVARGLPAERRAWLLGRLERGVDALR
jgi:hypothetical protein